MADLTISEAVKLFLNDVVDRVDESPTDSGDPGGSTPDDSDANGSEADEES